MANYITVTTTSLPPFTLCGSAQAAVDMLIEQWRPRLDLLLRDKPDLLVLPEHADHPSGLPAEQRDSFLEARGDRFRDLVAQTARDHRCYITCPTVRLAEDGSKRNSIEMIDRAGDIMGAYDKNFLTLGELDAGVTPGASPRIFECDFGRVGGVICFDLNFGDLCDAYAREKLDLIAFCSMYHGGLMQRFWAYMCRAHFVGAVGVGNLPGTILAPTGELIATTTNYTPHVTARINLDARLVHLDHHWQKLDALKAAYGPEVRITDPGELGSVLISSESPRRSTDDLLAEFEIEPLDDYLARAAAANRQGVGV